VTILVRVKKRRSSFFAALIVVVLSLIVVPFASAVSSRNYWYQSNLIAGGAGTDWVFHNHTYNEMYWGPGANYPGEIFQEVMSGAKHYYHSFNGNFGTTDPGAYYTAPLCGNRDSQAHFVNHCLASWG
jgi:hypothetical protein